MDIRRSAPLILAVALVCAGLQSRSLADPLRRPQGELVPEHGALFGTTPGGPRGGNYPTLEQKIGRKFDIINHFYDWRSGFPTQDELDLQKSGERHLMISWGGTDLASIVHGDWDVMIRDRALALASMGNPVFLRWGYEMNGDWKPWGGPNNMPNGPSKFRHAWRRIFHIFHVAGADNVIWVWAPNWESIPKVRDAPWNRWQKYYPGDRYVDWIGIDGFNWGTTTSFSRGWTSMTTILRAMYQDYHRRKPMMVAETASVEQGGDKARWIRKSRYAIKRKFPAIAAFIYFNGADIGFRRVKWAATSSPAALQAYRAMAHDPFYNPV